MAKSKSPDNLPKLRAHGLPDRYEQRIQEGLAPLGYSLENPKRLAEAILQLSDFYLQNPKQTTPWDQKWAQAASLAYYFPLNYARNAIVAKEGQRLGFFTGLSQVIDFGAGSGGSLHGLKDVCENFASTFAVDLSSQALTIAERMDPVRDFHKIIATSSERAPLQLNATAKAQTLLLASYALTELERIPDWWLEMEALMIVEPSTQTDARRLMKVRSDLIDAGFQIWAPCTHAGACPLLSESAKDWCHDRVHWLAPDWLTAIESHLPMKNKTVTMSYFLARRSAAPPPRLAKLARLTGDTLLDKGKSRQSVCRGPKREFLAWFPQRLPKDSSLGFERGNLLRFSVEPEKKSNELRLRHPDDVIEISLDDILS